MATKPFIRRCPVTVTDPLTGYQRCCELSDLHDGPCINGGPAITVGAIHPDVRYVYMGLEVPPHLRVSDRQGAPWRVIVRRIKYSGRKGRSALRKVRATLKGLKERRVTRP